jgi:hypothetical protein
MRRTVRRFIEGALPIAGSSIIFLAILFLYDPVVQIAVAAVGVLMIQAGIWKLTQPILPSERQYQALRREVDYFIGLVRRLNAAALGVKESDNQSTRYAFDEAQQLMRESYDRMTQLAGKTDEEAAELKLTTSQVPAE